MAKTTEMNLSQTDWVAKQETVQPMVILDVRTAEEFGSGHIPGAQNLDVMQAQGFMDGLSKLAPESHYFVYCRSGARSAQACQILSQSGISNVYNLLGGIMEWEGPTE